MCFEMWLAVVSNPWFIEAHREYLDYIIKKEKLTEGDGD